MQESGSILKVNIEEEMKSSYIDYSMSVIVSRALPDVRDGLKPVHRRVLFGMNEMGIFSNRPHKKSARIVGEVLGKYHPHGDSSVYDAMVRMAQPWSLRYPLVHGQGNFGSVDGDGPAAMRYTEVRLEKLAEEMLRDIDKNTVDFQLNFDDSLKEPTVLPTRLPTLLINGASGIAVGMATNMAPHNLSDIIDALVAYIDNNAIEINELIDIVKAPDFPTGGIIYGYTGVREAFETGKGRIVIRSKYEVEQHSSGKEQLIITEIPYQVNKAEMIKKIADLVNDKRIDGISNINDESDRNGMRIVIDLKRDANSEVIINTLFKLTPLQTSFNVNNIVLVNGRPKLLNLKELIHYFIAHRHEVIIRRTKYELEQAQKREHILAGLIIAVDHIDEVINIIRTSKTVDEAKERLMSRFKITDIQSRAIVDMRLRTLTGLERDKLKAEYEELLKLIEHLQDILSNETLRMKIIKEELLEIKEKYGDERRSIIEQNAEEFNPEDFYANDDMVITISHLGYIKRTPLADYRLQRRGGVGSRGTATRDEDFVKHMYIAKMHSTMLFFTKFGRVHWLKVYQIAEGTKNSKGRAIQNILNIDPNDRIKAFFNVCDLKDQAVINNHFVILVSKQGIIKKTKLEAYSHPRSGGINAITIKENDELLDAVLTTDNMDIILATNKGKAVRFKNNSVRPIGRTASGVKGISLGKDDFVIGMIAVEDNSEDVMVISENGYGKRSSVEAYRLTKRGAKGVKTMNITDKTGKLISIHSVTDKNHLMIINTSGITIRMDMKTLRTMGRATQGVRLINLKENDTIAAVAKISDIDDGMNTDNDKKTEEQERKDNQNPDKLTDK